MFMKKSLSQLVTDLQKENESLQSLKKLFDKACRNEFGYDVKTLHQIIEKQHLYDKRTAESQALGFTAPILQKDQTTTVTRSEIDAVDKNKAPP